MDALSSFIMSVMASVVAHYLCKHSPLRTRRFRLRRIRHRLRIVQPYPNAAILPHGLSRCRKTGDFRAGLFLFGCFFFLAETKEKATAILLFLSPLLFRNFLRRVAVEAVMAAELAHAAVDDGLD